MMMEERRAIGKILSVRDLEVYKLAFITASAQEVAETQTWLKFALICNAD